MNFPSIRVILIETQHPGNIGATARAMKTMGLTDLYLVNPCPYSHTEGMGKAMAAGAEDVLQQARVVANLGEALQDCTWIVATSARVRDCPWPMQNPREVAQTAWQQSGPVAIIFGRERNGLVNEELQRAHVHMQIPANPNYPSLNLAQAVQVVAYELNVERVRLETSTDLPVKPLPDADRLATDAEMQGFYQHLEQMLYALNFFHPRGEQALMRRLRRLFQRAHLEFNESNILRGLFTAVIDQTKQSRVHKDE